MHIERIGVDESVAAIVPPEALAAALDSGPAAVEVVTETTALAESFQAVVTFAYRESFLDLEWIHSVQSGVDRFPQETLSAAGVRLTNSTGIHGDAIGETVAGYVLAFSRRLSRYLKRQPDRKWEPPAWDEAWTVAGERACVVGMGTLGRGVVDRLSGLDLDLVGVRRDPIPEPGVETMYTTDHLKTAVEDARFLVLAVPLTDTTRGLIDADVLKAMRADAYLINVARGGVVDQAALVAALRDGQIKGAALDVFETEPLPDSSPLWEMEEVIVSPHCGAFTHAYGDRVADIVRENCERAARDDPLVNRVC